MNKIKPGISVLMANYNNGRFIADAISSVINQTFKNWQLLIVDDCSTDNSIDIIKNFGHDERIKLIIHKENKGYIKTLKELISKAEGEIVVTLDSDDVLLEDALELVDRAYKENPDCGFVYSQFEFCDESLKTIKKGYCDKIPLGKSNIFKPYVSALRSFKKGYYYLTSGYDEAIIYAEDVDIILKLEEVVKFYFIDKILYKHRIIPTSQSHDKFKREIGVYSRTVAQYNAWQRRRRTVIPNILSREMSNRFLFAFVSCLRIGEFKKAVYCLRTGINLYPFNFYGWGLVFFRLIKFIPYRLFLKITTGSFAVKDKELC